MSEKNPGAVLLSAQSIGKGFGAQPVLEDISLTIHEGERVGLIGRNGCGKSTLLNILTGAETPDEGRVNYRQGLRIAKLDQECELERSKTVGTVLDEACAELRSQLDEYNQLTERLANDSLPPQERKRVETRCAQLQHNLEVHGGWDLSRAIKTLATSLNLPPENRVLETLSGGELRRVDLAATLLTQPDLLLLDEPTNHIDVESIEWMQSYLAGYSGSCVLVTHDRYFLESVVNRIVELEFNHLISFPGNYARFLEYKSQVQEAESKTEAARQRTLRRELAWLRRGPKARGTKQKARIQRYEELESQGGPAQHKEIGFEIPQPPRLGKDILEARNIGYWRGDEVLFHNLSFIVQKHMRIGLVGPNGCGKTTLLRVLMGKEQPKEGEVRIGSTTEFLYVDQSHEEIKPEQSVLDFVSNGQKYWDVNGKRTYVPAYLENLLFDMDTVMTPIRNLSGGERNRMELAKKLLQGGNMLVLDEPTNDLDLSTLRVLEEAVDNFGGCALLVSHDRYFLNRLCTHLIVWEGPGDVLWFTGNYDDYRLYKQKTQFEVSAEKPKTKREKPVRKERETKRLTYKEKEELKQAEGLIEDAEAKVAELEGVVSDPAFYEQDHTKVQQVLDDLEEARRRVETLYARWADLEARAHIK